MKKQDMTICLWFDDQAEEAVDFYTSVFKDSSKGTATRYTKEGFEFHRKPEGSVMTIEFTLNGMKFLALNGGPVFRFNEAVSIVVNCETQEEIDYYWAELTSEGEESQCGWLKDKFGVSWQIAPSNISELMSDKDIEARIRVERALYPMKKIDIEILTNAYHGVTV